MFRLNLSTRPFYNDRAVHVVLGVLALALVLVTVLNAQAVVNLSRRQTELRTSIGADEARVADLRQRATALRAQLRQDELEAVLAGAREANTLIDRRTFSWTELFNHLEATLPGDVMLTSVRPQVEPDGINVAIGVRGKSTEAVDRFLRQLEATGAFSQLLSQSETPDDDGLLRVVIVGRYAPGGSKPGPEAQVEAEGEAAALPPAPQEARR